MNERNRTAVMSTNLRRIAGGVLGAAVGAVFLAAGTASAQPQDHVVNPSVTQPGGAPGGWANHMGVPPGSALWPGNVNPSAPSRSDTGSNSAVPIDPADHPREAPGSDTARF